MAVAIVAVLLVPTRALAEEIRVRADVGALCTLSVAAPEEESLLRFAQAANRFGVAGEAALPALAPTAIAATQRAYIAERTRALMASWRASFGASSYTLMEPPDAAGLQNDGATTILVGVDDTLPLAAGAHALELAGLPLAVPCKNEEARTQAWLAHGADLLELSADFRLISAEDSQRSFCKAQDETQWIVRGEPLGLQLKHAGTGAVLCQVETPLGMQRRLQEEAASAAGVDWGAVVRVTRVEVISDEGVSDIKDSGLRARMISHMESSLLPCYQQALCRSGGRQGALSIRTSVKAGRLRNPSVTVDALDSDAIAGCVLDRMQTVPRIQLDADELGWVVIFRQEARDTVSTDSVRTWGAMTRGAVGAVSGTLRE